MRSYAEELAAGYIDPECAGLIEALNRLPGLETFESCSGHGAGPLRVWFWAQTLDALTPLLQEIDNGGRRRPFEIRVHWAGIPAKPSFCLEGPADAANMLAGFLLLRGTARSEGPRKPWPVLEPGATLGY